MKLTYEELQDRIWTPGELAEYANLQELRRQVNRQISTSPFDTQARIKDDLLKKAIRIQKQ